MPDQLLSRFFATIDISPEDTPAALAAAGALWSHFKGRAGEADDLAAIVNPESPEILSWSSEELPGPVFLRASTLAEAWQQAVANRSTPLRLEIAGPLSAESTAWSQLLEKAPRVTAVFNRLEIDAKKIEWEWPVRIGVAPRRANLELAMRLRRVIEIDRPWLRPLVQWVELDEPGREVDMLFLTDPGPPWRQLWPRRDSVGAHLIFVVGDAARPGTEQAEWLRTMAAWTQAQGVALAPLPVAEAELWFRKLIAELAHNTPLDLAWRYTTQELPPGSALLAASRPLLTAISFEAFLKRLLPQLKQLSGSMPLSPRMLEHLGRPLDGPARMPFREIARRLAARAAQFGFLRESDEATTIATIAATVRLARLEAERKARREAEAQSSRSMEISPGDGPSTGASHGWAPTTPSAPMAPRPPQEFAKSATSKGDEPPKDEKRFLQAAVRGVDAAGAVSTTERQWLETQKPHRAEIWISAENRGRWTAGEAFPDHELPPDRDGHVLTVVFSEPQALAQPEVQKIFLPRSGPSTRCEFQFQPGAEQALFEGRVIILFKNRVLQTALLRLPVTASAPAEPPSEADTRGFGLIVEAKVRSFEGPLEDGRAIAEALILNHSADKVARATRVNGAHASLIALDGLGEAMRELGEILNRCRWEDKALYLTLEAPETVELLRELAAVGRMLYEALEMQGVQPEHQTGPLQVIAAKMTAHLPLEFCYTREPPMPKDTRLCPRAREGLQLGRCPGGCHAPGEENTVICPLAFWGVQRVIEWHCFDAADQSGMGRMDFALQAVEAPRAGQLPRLSSLLLGASGRVENIAECHTRLGNFIKPAPHRANSWQEWRDAVQQWAPPLLVLMVHVDSNALPRRLEMNNDTVEHLRREFVCSTQQGGAPVVLLLGCGTALANVSWQRYPMQLRHHGAAIVVSSLAELLGSQATQLAEWLVAALTEAQSAKDKRYFGEIMLQVKRTALLQGKPIGLALVAYGDADWWL